MSLLADFFDGIQGLVGGVLGLIFAVFAGCLLLVVTAGVFGPRRR